MRMRCENTHFFFVWKGKIRIKHFLFSFFSVLFTVLRQYHVQLHSISPDHAMYSYYLVFYPWHDRLKQFGHWSLIHVPFSIDCPMHDNYGIWPRHHWSTAKYSKLFRPIDGIVSIQRNRFELSSNWVRVLQWQSKNERTKRGKLWNCANLNSKIKMLIRYLPVDFHFLV